MIDCFGDLSPTSRNLSVGSGAAVGEFLESTLAFLDGDMVAQVIGIHQRAGDLKVNVCKKKAVTNMRASGTDNKTPLVEPIIMGLDEALEYIVDDEMVEVTPVSVRIRKRPAAKRPGQK
jgi:GTP-binding protein